MLGKTASRQYREYAKAGGTLGFTEFLEREKEKTFAANGEDDRLLLIDRSLNDSVHKVINDTLSKGGLKDKESGKTIFGINKTLVFVGGGIIAGVCIYLIIKKYKE